MDVYDKSSISTSSRLTPSENEELKINPPSATQTSSLQEPGSGLSKAGVRERQDKQTQETVSNPAISLGGTITTSTSRSNAAQRKKSKKKSKAAKQQQQQEQIAASAPLTVVVNPPLATSPGFSQGDENLKGDLTSDRRHQASKHSDTTLEEETDCTSVSLVENRTRASASFVEDDEDATVVASSRVSVHSSSPTVVSSSRGRPASSVTSHSLSNNNPPPTTGIQEQTQLQPSHPPVDQQTPQPALLLDPVHFKSVFQQLASSTETIQVMNDDILESMTLLGTTTLEMALQDPNTTSTLTGPTTASLLSDQSVLRNGRVTDDIEKAVPEQDPVQDEKKKKDKGKEKAMDRPMDLEEERRRLAQSMADLMIASWPRICTVPRPLPSSRLMVSTPPMAATSAPILATASTTGSGVSDGVAAPAGSLTSVAAAATTTATGASTLKLRIKIATQLKNAIVALWSAQSYFTDRAQLILDIAQDPRTLEQDTDRLRILRSRHLNNLLDRTLTPLEMGQLYERIRSDHDQMMVMMEQLQPIWLGILLFLGDPDLASSKMGAQHHRSQGGYGRHSNHHALYRINTSSSGVSSFHLHRQGGDASSSSSYYYNPYDPTASAASFGSSPVFSVGGHRSGSGRRLFRISRNKRLALKVAVLLMVGAGMIAMALILNTR